ncbi:MAG: hypothetical protein LC659_13415, partial [Myxococcales bacterium]|nr:hypothetical protein [Myxococcales bacterium]
LTNILFSDAFHLTFAAFAIRMLAPHLVALATTYALLRWHFRHQLPRRFEGDSLPDARTVVPSRAYFVACVAVLVVVLVGYFLAPLVGVEPYAVAFAGGGLLAVAAVVTRRIRVAAFRELSWDLFPFVVGLFIAVRALENLGIVGESSGWLAQVPPGSIEKLLAAAGTTALASNVMNNLPAALIARSVLRVSHAHTGTVLAALIGANAGSIVTPFGSLATMLVLGIARREREEVRAAQVMLLGAWTAPIIVCAATLALSFAIRLMR